jgi:hypothetical protein
MVTSETERAFLEDVLLGNKAAIAFCIACGQLSQVVDDIIDCDVPLIKSDVVAAFHTALVSIPLNPFYREHIEVLAPVLTVIFSDYNASVELEQMSPHDKTLAYVLRDNFISLITICAVIVGGARYGIECTTRVRQFFHDETLETYLEKLV